MSAENVGVEKLARRVVSLLIRGEELFVWIRSSIDFRFQSYDVRLRTGFEVNRSLIWFGVISSTKNFSPICVSFHYGTV